MGNTGPYGDPPLKIKISKIGLRHVLSWPKVGLEPKFHDPGTFGGFGNRENKVLSDIQRIFNTGPYGDPPLKIKILKSGFLHAREDQKIDPEPKFHGPRSIKWQRLGRTTEKGSIFNTGPYGDPSLKIKILTIGLRHVLSWPKLSLEPKFHDPGTFFTFLP